jgi:hypothetical protein
MNPYSRQLAAALALAAIAVLFAITLGLVAGAW